MTENDPTSTEDGNSGIAESQEQQAQAAETQSQAPGAEGHAGQDAGQQPQDGQREAEPKQTRADIRVQQALRDRNAAIGFAERTLAEKAALEKEIADRRPEQFRTDEEYARAVAQDAARQVGVQMLGRQAATAQAQAEYAAHDAWQARIADIRARTPDFDAKVHDPNLTITPIMADAIRESDVGGEIAYYLAENKAEAFRIANLPPVSQAVAIARLEGRVAKSQAQPSQAPAPITALKGKSGGSGKSLEAMSFEEYRKARGF
jgi:hypothetical protein